MGGLNCARAPKDPGTNNSANDRLEFAKRKLPVDSTAVVSDADAPGRKKGFKPEKRGAFRSGTGRLSDR